MPSIVVERSIDADAVVDLLEPLAAQRGAPGFVRFDHGPEFIAHAVADWCRFNHVATVFIDPGSPWQNAWIESFNGRLRNELLNSWQFDSLLEAQVIIEDWRIDYNEHRPDTAQGDLTQPSSPRPGPSSNQKPHSAWTTERVPLTVRVAASVCYPSGPTPASGRDEEREVSPCVV